LKNKLRILTALIVLCAICALTAVLFLSYNLKKRYDSGLLRNLVVGFVENKFDKAVRFDSIGMSYSGDIVIKNLKISAFNDFNDNILLVDSPKTVIELDLFSLFNGEIQIEDVSIYSANFTIHKAYDALYGEAFSVVTGIYKQFAQSKELSKKKISLKIRDSSFTYSEIFRSDALRFTASSFNLDIAITRDEIKYSAKGAFNKGGTPFIDESPFTVGGTIFFNDGKFHGTSVEYSVVNLDLTYLNAYLKFKSGLSHEIAGAMSSKGAVNILRDNATINSESSFTGLSLKNVSRVEDSFTLVNNKNLKASLNLDILNGGEVVVARRFLLDDDNLYIMAEGEYVNTELSHYLKLNARSNRIDLNQLSGTFRPVKNVSYSGGLQFDFSTDYNINSGKNNRSSVVLHLNDFSAERIEDGLAKSFFRNTDVKISGTEKQLDAKADARSFGSDYKITIKSELDSWVPVAGNTVIDISSEQLEASLITRLVAEGQLYLENTGLADTKEGYDGVMFPDKEYGKFLTNNSIDLSFRCGSLVFRNNAQIKNIVLRQILEDKMLSTETFSASGYDAQYILDLYGNFKGMYAKVQAKAGVYDFNFARFFKDTGARGEVGGTLRGEYSWSVDGYRLRDLVLNNRSSFELSLKNGYVKGTKFLDEYYTFLASEGVTAQPETVEFSDATYRLKKNSLSCYTSALLTGKSASISSSGPYLFGEGYSMPLRISLTEDNGDKIRRESGQFLLTGVFTSPVLQSRTDPDMSIELFR